MRKQLSFLITFGFLAANFSVGAQCATEVNIYSFTYNGINYEIVKENKNWDDAAACAVERGGFLARIDSADENAAVFSAASTDAGIVVANTVAPDGGGASYLWLGGTDKNTEGDWIWDGTDSGSGDQFWQGTSEATGGVPIGGLYNNWGNEPDDFGAGQDGLGLAITNWPLGVAGEWNDVASSNTLYYIIEYPDESGIEDNSGSLKINIYPNPSSTTITIDNNSVSTIESVSIYTHDGKLAKNSGAVSSLDVADLESGTYFVRVKLANGQHLIEKFVK